MTKAVLTPFMHLQVQLALANSLGNSSLLRSLEKPAAGLGLSGAEIDAARRGRSFDAATDIAIAYALAVRHDDMARMNLCENRLVQFGLADLPAKLAALVKAMIEQTAAENNPGND